MKITIASLKRRLPVGTRFRGRYTGPNQSAGVSRDWHEREVKGLTSSQMRSQFLNGPNAGELIWLDWAGVRATDHGGEVGLAYGDGPEFLRLAFGEAAVAS